MTGRHWQTSCPFLLRDLILLHICSFAGMVLATLPEEIQEASFGVPSSEDADSNGFRPRAETPVFSRKGEGINRLHESSRTPFLRLVSTIVAVTALVLLTLQCFRILRILNQSSTGIDARSLAVGGREPCYVNVGGEGQKFVAGKESGTSSAVVEQQRILLTVTKDNSERLTDAEKRMVQEAHKMLTSACQRRERARRKLDAYQQMVAGYRTILEGRRQLEDPSATENAQGDLEKAEKERQRAEAELLSANRTLLGLRPSQVQHLRSLEKFLVNEWDRGLPFAVIETLAAAEAITSQGASQLGVTLAELSEKSAQYAEFLKGSAREFVQWFDEHLPTSYGTELFFTQLGRARDLVDLARRYCVTLQSAFQHPLGEETAQEVEALSKVLETVIKKHSMPRSFQDARKLVSVVPTPLPATKSQVTMREGRSLGELESRLTAHSKNLRALLESTTSCGDTWKDLENEFSSALKSIRLVPADLVRESFGLQAALKSCKEQLSEVLISLEARWTSRIRRLRSHIAGSCEKIDLCFANIHLAGMVYEDPLAREIHTLSNVVAEGKAFSELLSSLQFLGDATENFRNLVVDFRKELFSAADRFKYLNSKCEDRWLSRLTKAAELYTASSRGQEQRALLWEAIKGTEQDVRLLHDAQNIAKGTITLPRRLFEKVEQLRALYDAEEKKSNSAFGTIRKTIKAFKKK